MIEKYLSIFGMTFEIGYMCIFQNFFKTYFSFLLQFATNMEKNKLFVKGLPFKITKEELQELFEKVSIVLFCSEKFRLCMDTD